MALAAAASEEERGALAAAARGALPRMDGAWLDWSHRPAPARRSVSYRIDVCFWLM
jgi:hypothetical protein